MKQTGPWLICAASILSIHGAAWAAPKLEGMPVDYTAGGVTLKGYLVYDESATAKRPGVLVVHEWWGQNEYARKRARMLAELGYTALAVDMYGEGKTAEHPDEAGKFSSETMKNFPVAKARFQAAIDLLKRQPTVDPSRLAAIGYCFGGGVVLNMARQGVDLLGVASFHGNLTAVEPAKPGALKAKIRVYTGGDDKFVPVEAIEAFEKEMTEAKADYKVMILPGALHSFTNPDATEVGTKHSLPLAYNADADQVSWADMKEFFAEIFKK
ncbi:MAG: dienelactone hydrolase family protein [Acidobacteria bacterium]|nr:dienelactone hydrolase family protein [Acidobacteriota bacterium]